MQGNMTVLVALQSCRRLCAVGFTVIQEIKTVLSQAACLHLIRQTQKKYYYEN